MNKDNLIELRNKVIQLFQITSLIESGGLEVKESVDMMRDISKFMMESIETAIEAQYKSENVYDPAYDLLYEPIEVSPETLSTLEDYLELCENKNLLKDKLIS